MPVPNAAQIISRCRELATISDVDGCTKRTFLSNAMRLCNKRVASWMEGLGMRATTDAVGNLRGVHSASTDHAGRVLIGSHLDTVENAGAFDGILGVVMGVALVEGLNGQRLPFEIEVVGFSEEEGVRFGLPFIGSRALAGTLDDSVLSQTDDAGISVEKAILDFGLNLDHLPAARLHERTFGFVEFHIEQGPLLESLNEPLAVVESIAGQSRVDVAFLGQANHAGTTPMQFRHDALAGAAEWVVAVEGKARETPGLVATVGKLNAKPGQSNVIPGEVQATLDIRHSQDAVRIAALADLQAQSADIAARRKLTLEWKERSRQQTTPMDARLTGMLEQAVRKAGFSPRRMASGAGHDAMILAKQIPACMLFLRSPGGISHHPSENVLVKDVQLALEAGMNLLEGLVEQPLG